MTVIYDCCCWFSMREFEILPAFWLCCRVVHNTVCHVISDHDISRAFSTCMLYFAKNTCMIIHISTHNIPPPPLTPGNFFCEHLLYTKQNNYYVMLSTVLYEFNIQIYTWVLHWKAFGSQSAVEEGWRLGEDDILSLHRISNSTASINQASYT